MGGSKLFHIKLIFAFAVTLLLTLSIFSFLRVNNLLRTSEMVNHTNVIKLELESIFSRIKDADSEQRGFVLTKDTVYISQFKHSLKDIASRLHKLDVLTKDNYSQQRNIEDLRWVINKRVIHMQDVIKDTQLKPDQKITKERWLEARAIMDEIKLQTNKMMNEESFLLKLRTKSFTEESTFTPLFTIFLTICSIIIMIAAYYGISRELRVSNRLRSDLEESKKELLDANIGLEEKNSSLAKMNKELESFTYISSHDLQEPLRKIQTFISRIIDVDDEKLSDNGKSYLKRTQDAANRMQGLIRDLLAYSRLNVEIFPIENTNLKLMVAEVESELEEEILNSKAEIIVKGEPDVKIIISQFRQLLTNLISNSLKFSNPDIPPQIVIENVSVNGNELPFEDSNQSQRYSRITISDNGIGFDPQYKTRIFEVFQRLHVAKEYPGTGIGLAIVKKIVENHNGFIAANSQPNGGAVFTIYLPC